jgi:hypothetical protein
MTKNEDKGFKSYLGKIKWILAGLIAITVSIGMSKPDAPFRFPPAGSLSEFVLPFSFLAVVVTLALPWFIHSAPFARRLAILAAALCALSFVGYFLLVHAFVVPVPIPAIHDTTHAIVGYQRTPYAEQRYRGRTDAEMVKQGGSDDAALSELYTVSSRTVVLLLMFLAYVGIPISVAVVLGCLSRSDQLQP